jgi:hypothetical protein
MSINPLQPSASLLCKIGSVIVHFDEAASPDGRHLDMDVARRLLADPDVSEWIAAMNSMALLPVKRRNP